MLDCIKLAPARAAAIGLHKAASAQRLLRSLSFMCLALRHCFFAVSVHLVRAAYVGLHHAHASLGRCNCLHTAAVTQEECQSLCGGFNKSSGQPMLDCITLTPAWDAAIACTRLHPHREHSSAFMVSYNLSRQPMLGCITLTPAWAAALACCKLHTCTEIVRTQKDGHAVMSWLCLLCQIIRMWTAFPWASVPHLKSYKMARSFQSETVRYSQQHIVMYAMF